MNADRMKELWLAIACIAIAVIGVVIDATARDVVAPEVVRSEDLFVQRSIYCGGVPEASTSDGKTIVPDATAHAVAGPVDTEPMSIEDETADQGPQDVSGNVVAIDRSRRGPITVTGYDGRILGASSLVYGGQVPGPAKEVSTNGSRCTTRSPTRPSCVSASSPGEACVRRASSPMSPSPQRVRRRCG
jgi:hypothetical protein